MNRKHIVALSGGKGSTAMALELAEREPNDYVYVCTPTGNDPPAMFAHWVKCNQTGPFKSCEVKGVWEVISSIQTRFPLWFPLWFKFRGEMRRVDALDGMAIDRDGDERYEFGFYFRASKGTLLQLLFTRLDVSPEEIAEFEAGLPSEKRAVNLKSNDASDEGGAKWPY